MAKRREVKARVQVYRAPSLMIAVSWGILLVWTLICLSLIKSIFGEWGWSGALQLFIIVFLLLFGWAFFLAISYRLEQGKKGDILLISPRKAVRAEAKDVTSVELPGAGIGLVRFRLGKGKVYLFCTVKNETLKEILLTLKELNPDMEFKNLKGVV
ncbi:MAG: hypothetical protein JRH06_02970 [Deltaproteobacteria bacterium]|nr:hypothetical protein [Deltaproteobacteria bacterium]MBW2136500.1 hypothetical protein [Deltaproteobacteria bacterium]